MAQPAPNEPQSSPAVTPDSIKSILTNKLDAQHVEVEDLSAYIYITMLISWLMGWGVFAGGCGQAFQAIIVSPQFESKTTLARHRLVNSALKAEIAAIHAWTPKCYTPEQWEKTKQ
ncbi:BolA domain-containing protein [Trichophyton tonsurans CBS 112818]|uniref:BolA domain-containing protein n=1 Tax=Trichophyton tonsurans (strain CBS 112818) TaxID=647933 RepID=F2RQ79_TRIT1|nr:BolA domain-containing protein [Trichophyton tonsurans CBS 112818]